MCSSDLSKADAESKRFESDKKIQLLESALKRYKNLHILDDVVEDDDNGQFSLLYHGICSCS